MRIAGVRRPALGRVLAISAMMALATTQTVLAIVAAAQAHDANTIVRQVVFFSSLLVVC